MGNYPNITYKRGSCNPCNKGREYPEINYKPSLLQDPNPETRFKPDEIAKYKGERVRVLQHIGDWVSIWIPSRQEEVSVHPEKLEREVGKVTPSTSKVSSTEKLYQRGADGYPIGSDKIMRDAWGSIPNPDQPFWSRIGFVKPTKIYGWQWSADYNQWRAYVKFPDGTETWTSPREQTAAYPEVSYRPSLLREQVTPVSPEVTLDAEARREQMRKDLMQQEYTIKQEIMKEIRSYQPMGKMSEVGEVLGVRPTKGVLVSTPFGSYIFAKARLPDTGTVRRWGEKYKEAEELGRRAATETTFMVVGPGLTTGNIRNLEQGRKLKAQGLLSPRELKYVDAMEEFWAKYPDADYGVVQPDGSIKPSTRFKPAVAIPKAKSNPSAYPEIRYSTLKVKPVAKVVTVPGGSEWRCEKCGKALTSGSQAVKMGARVFCIECVRRSQPSLLFEAEETLKIRPLTEKVWLVNGQQVRDRLDVDFVLGGHDLRYPFIPAGEIWIDEATSPEERECLIAHEVEERRLMAEGVGYSKAHGAANLVETECRSANIDLLASTEGNPLRKFCCRQCGECAPKELLEEGRFADRIAWLRHHYKEKHPSMWGKSYPEVKYKPSYLKETQEEKLLRQIDYWQKYQNFVQNRDVEDFTIAIRDMGMVGLWARYNIPRLPGKTIGSYDVAYEPAIGDIIEHLLVSRRTSYLKEAAVAETECQIISPQYYDLLGWLNGEAPDYSFAIEPEVKERKIDEVLQKLKDGVGRIHESALFRDFLLSMSKFHYYSIYNQILIMLQRPTATRVAGYVTWQDLGRQVKAGEKGIAILAPCLPPRILKCPLCEKTFTERELRTHLVEFHERVDVSILVREAREEAVGVPTARHFKVVNVFDISQTVGKPLPEIEVPTLTGAYSEDLYDRLMELATKHSVTVSLEPKPGLDPQIKGTMIDKSIWVKPDEPEAQRLKTLGHELAHYFTEAVFAIPKADAEVIAESVAFVVCARFGFDTGTRSFPYVALWAKEKKVLEQNLASIRKISGRIIDEV